jgi:MarR family transcriptional regulator, transcriptional regulator for hemolysin
LPTNKRPGEEGLTQQQQVSTLMHEISLMVGRSFNRQVKDMGLTRSQWQVLYLLYMEGEQTQTAIADKLMMAKPPLGKVIERLEAAKWIERREASNDRRAKVVCLTEKIQPMLKTLKGLVEGISETAMQGMTKKESTQFYKLLKTVHANLVEAN